MKLKRFVMDHYTLCAADYFDIPYAKVTREMRTQMKEWMFGISYGMSQPYGFVVCPSTKDLLTINHWN